MNKYLSQWGNESGDIPTDYMSSLQLMIHEASHSDSKLKEHITCTSLLEQTIDYNMDSDLKSGAFSNAATYLIGVYKYSLYDPPLIKESAKNLAINLLRDGFCGYPTHPNKKVQDIVDELLKEDF